MSAYGDSLRELCKGFDGNLELIKRAERIAEQIDKRRVLGGYSISFHSKPIHAEKAGGKEPCELDQT